MINRKERDALLVRCSGEEAQAIRDAAKRERRTLSGFVVNALMSRINNAEETAYKVEECVAKTTA